MMFLTLPRACASPLGTILDTFGYEQRLQTAIPVSSHLLILALEYPLLLLLLFH